MGSPSVLVSRRKLPSPFIARTPAVVVPIQILPEASCAIEVGISGRLVAIGTVAADFSSNAKTERTDENSQLPGDVAERHIAKTSSLVRLKIRMPASSNVARQRSNPKKRRQIGRASCR